MSGMVQDYMKNVYDYEYEYKVLPYSLRLKCVFALYLNQERKFLMILMIYDVIILLYLAMIYWLHTRGLELVQKGPLTNFVENSGIQPFITFDDIQKKTN